MAITTDGQVIDVFTAAGLQKPDISILDDRFLAEVRGLKHKNVAAELLAKATPADGEVSLLVAPMIAANTTEHSRNAATAPWLR